MTNNPGIVERLRARGPDFGRRADEVPALRNPDGEAAAATIEMLLSALEANRETLAEQVRRCERWGKSHHELDTAIEETDTTLHQVRQPT